MTESKLLMSIIQLLADGQFHSIAEIEAQYQLTDLSLFKTQLTHWGLTLFYDKQKGFRLQKPLKLLNKKIIESHIAGNVVLYDSIASTNQYMLEHIHDFNQGDVCLAEQQFSGKGRRGRHWYSPFGVNLYLSFYWYIKEDLQAGLSLAVGLAIAESLTELTGKKIQVKWPNDLYLEGKKVGGILIESLMKKGNGIHLVIGIGLNLMMQQVDNNIVTQEWAALGEQDRNALAINVVQKLQHMLPIFEKEGLTPFVLQWPYFDVFYDRWVSLMNDTEVINGIAKGINEKGALLLQQNDKLLAIDRVDFSLRLMSNLP